MAFLKVLSCNLIFIAAALSTDEHVPLSKFDILYQQHYDIKFILSVDHDVFYGEYNVSFYIPYDTQDIYVYTETLTVIQVIVTDASQISEENNEELFPHEPIGFTYNSEIRITTISFAYYLPSGFYTLNMKFMGIVSENGGFRTSYINQQNDRVWLAATHYYKFATRRLFPLLKDTTYASYTISIRHPKNYKALSNMPVQKVNLDKNNTQWTQFKTTPVMPVHFIALIVGHLVFTSETNQSTKLWCRKEMLPHVKFAYTVAKNITQFLEKKLPYIRKTPETNQIAIPKLLDAEDIMLGVVLYKEADIIFNEETDTEGRKIEITRQIGYKMVHEWFYNKINLSEWHPWLHKGFATFFGIYATDKSFPHLRMQDFFVVQMQYEVLHWFTKDTWPDYLQLDISIAIPRYIKASIMFRTFQNALTEEVFRNGIETYLRHQYENSSFWNVMQHILDTTSLEMKYNLKDRITNWTQLNHYPVVNVNINYDVNSLNLLVENFNSTIEIPVSITTQTHSDLKKIFPVEWIAQGILYQLPTRFIDMNDWVLVNLQQRECYRVNYDAENWYRLSKYLNSKLFRKIHVLDRAKLIDDSFHFVMTGKLNSNVFLNISQYLWRDRDYIAWYPMFKILEYMSGFFAFPRSTSVKIRIVYPLKVILWGIGYPNFTLDRNIEGNIFTKCLREEAAKWLCILSDSYCFSIANRELKSYLLSRNESSPYKIWNGWKEWTFCNGLITASNDTWMHVFNIYLKESDFSVLKFLACSKNSTIILQYIELMTLSTALEKVITNFDHINSFCSIVARHANNIEVLDIILHNLEKIKPKKISFTTAITMIINHVYSKRQFNKIKKYVQDNIRYFFTYPAPSLNNYDHRNDNKFNNFSSKNDNETYKEIIIMRLNRKLELRLQQIRAQLYQYRQFIQDFRDVVKEYSAD
ncbi:thyrotropin-releasing hormone-degrading ectoenzyme-like [Camponotus floridanus]|uniref:thyrotropin-releasing hormone-degrading ectoenzyme-like n=1 Tax=Camponotus floridanus TaxID=104421 RepID=UPI000DC6AB83|nr:thyrotropin-releasing hormone-degrading ectoenzyme-like [Camponotus floridanus]